MDAIINNCRGTFIVPIDAKIFSEHRTVFIEDTITAKSANEIKRSIMYLLYEDANAPINIDINSPGGSIDDAGMMLYDIIKGLNIEVNVLCTGIAASMAAIIFAGIKKGHRAMLPHRKY